MPILPLTIRHERQEVDAAGLLDTGAAVNVMPYTLGEQLGLVWEQQRANITLAGNLASIPARGVIVETTIQGLRSARMAFAWAYSDDIRLILGQVNFFLEFDVCFFRSQHVFEVRRRP